MAEDRANELTRESGEKQAVTLDPEEANNLQILLNLELRKVSIEFDFAGRRTDPTLTQEQALPLNSVFKQLAGRDHDQYEKMFGSTMPAIDKAVKSNAIHIGDKERTAVLRLLDGELNRKGPDGRQIHPSDKYKETLLSLQQKLVVQNQPLPHK